MEQRDRTILALTMIDGLGGRKIKLLLGAVHQPEDLFNLSYKELIRIPGVGPNIAGAVSGFKSWDKVDEVLDQTEKTGSRILSIETDGYPDLLRQLPESPLLLWVKGNVDALSTDAIAVVGTRRASKYGREMAEKLTRELISSGFTITSGLAYGIDTDAHRICVEQGAPTVAVFGSGIDWIYPNSNIPLAHRILEEDGAWVSEFPPGTKPDAGNFPVRNRIVSGLSLGTLVIESGDEGGSMITAKMALDQNREVFAVPHPVGATGGAGCNMLIKNGMAKLVENIEDINSEIRRYYSKEPVTADAPKITKKPECEERTDLDDQSRMICKLLSEGPLHIDSISEQSGIPTDKLLVKLLELEFASCVKQRAGKYFELG